MSDRYGNYAIYVMNAKDGSKQQNHTNNAALYTSLDWGVVTQ